MKQAQADRQQAECTGRIAELAALAWLVCTGQRLLARRCKGEIELLVRHGRVIVVRHYVSPDLERRFGLIRIPQF